MLINAHNIQMVSTENRGKRWPQGPPSLVGEPHRQMQLFQEGKDGVGQGRASRKGSIYKDTRYERV